MKGLLRKEFTLGMHPASLLFPLLASMMLIPNYPLTVAFFYPCLGAFFLCLSARENQDLLFSLLLPVKKSDLPAARILTVAALQLATAALSVPFCFLRQCYPPAGNEVGLDANFAMLGVGAAEMGLFNLFFFPSHYRDPSKVGLPFLKGSLALFLWAMIWECLPHFVPFVRDRLDGPVTADPAPKLIVFVLGLLLFAVLTGLAVKLSQKRFERYDLS